MTLNLSHSEQHMREVAERRQQLELEHEQALAILTFKQDEIKRLQRVRRPLLHFLYSTRVLLANSKPSCPLWLPLGVGDFVQQEATLSLSTQLAVL